MCKTSQQIPLLGQYLQYHLCYFGNISTITQQLTSANKALQDNIHASLIAQAS